jgi:hypothetical protein
MINYEATQEGGNYLGKEVDITSIAAHFYSALLPVRCFPDEERDQETFLVLTRRSRGSIRSAEFLRNKNITFFLPLCVRSI